MHTEPSVTIAEVLQEGDGVGGQFAQSWMFIFSIF